MGYAPFVPRYGFEDAYPQTYVEVSPSGPWYSEEQPAVYWQQEMAAAQRREAAEVRLLESELHAARTSPLAAWLRGPVTCIEHEVVRRRYAAKVKQSLTGKETKSVAADASSLPLTVGFESPVLVQDMTAAERQRDEEGLVDGEGEGCSRSFADILGPNCVIKRVDKDQKVIGHAEPDEMQQELVARAATQKRLGACAEHVHHLPRKEKLQWALDLKDKANECYVQSRFEEAARLYNDCLVALDFDGKEDETAEVVAKLQLPVCTNLAACLIEMGKYEECAGLTPPFESGTLGNMFLDPALELNFTGIWWMDGNPLIWEQLVSFAGAQGMAPYPTTVYNPSSLAGHWTWSDNFFGRGIMLFYAFTEVAEATHDFWFSNKTYADIDATSDLVFGDGTFPMSKINEDEWDRVNSYVLRRIVYGDGTPHPVFWPKFLDWYKSTFPGANV
ncbi:hypothetical protein AK812_SmicGene21891 [Symbiodinium microadriaticum]|uniref:Uncharacterized protein n=1 Tax=Symbiodinium microadriaticum TaxID=2951 RepID=A0A1Q9DLA8_SYMMI|nr:hypothetical protein AK812_SmicGene21891 [Symbiodinium microadriaticum]